MGPSLANSLVFLCAALSMQGGLNNFLKEQDPKTNTLRQVTTQQYGESSLIHNGKKSGFFEVFLK